MPLFSDTRHICFDTRIRNFVTFESSFKNGTGLCTEIGSSCGVQELQCVDLISASRFEQIETADFMLFWVTQKEENKLFHVFKKATEKPEPQEPFPTDRLTHADPGNTRCKLLIRPALIETPPYTQAGSVSGIVALRKILQQP